ncbi:hypothetical protein TSOC_008230 [Tetrabaena socialis]|uniref:Uncharacterized protein n=1 Tax=Tetrabaena socialis TaxID=47790 RepID=A0A2J7ZZ02_9CHLO|nr:hypothetical protein TSOC_008230 [Tetrabaena socialis]|eukprot:PNH05500.1 hypothetical protein TSOC_008230 [Tetrabaena socialis]
MAEEPPGPPGLLPLGPVRAPSSVGDPPACLALKPAAVPGDRAWPLLAAAELDGRRMAAPGVWGVVPPPPVVVVPKPGRLLGGPQGCGQAFDRCVSAVLSPSKAAALAAVLAKRTAAWGASWTARRRDRGPAVPLLLPHRAPGGGGGVARGVGAAGAVAVQGGGVGGGAGKADGCLGRFLDRPAAGPGAGGAAIAAAPGPPRLIGPAANSPAPPRVGSRPAASSCERCTAPHGSGAPHSAASPSSCAVSAATMKGGTREGGSEASQAAMAPRTVGTRPGWKVRPHKRSSPGASGGAGSGAEEGGQHGRSSQPRRSSASSSSSSADEDSGDPLTSFSSSSNGDDEPSSSSSSSSDDDDEPSSSSSSTSDDDDDPTTSSCPCPATDGTRLTANVAARPGTARKTSTSPATAPRCSKPGVAGSRVTKREGSGVAITSEKMPAGGASMARGTTMRPPGTSGRNSTRPGGGGGGGGHLCRCGSRHVAHCKAAGCPVPARNQWPRQCQTRGRRQRRRPPVPQQLPARGALRRSVMTRAGSCGDIMDENTPAGGSRIARGRRPRPGVSATSVMAHWAVGKAEKTPAGGASIASVTATCWLPGPGPEPVAAPVPDPGAEAAAAATCAAAAAGTWRTEKVAGRPSTGRKTRPGASATSVMAPWAVGKVEKTPAACLAMEPAAVPGGRAWPLLVAAELDGRRMAAPGVWGAAPPPPVVMMLLLLLLLLLLLDLRGPGSGRPKPDRLLGVP